ncbi:curli assembly protein CsgF [Rhizorhapis suberifaciens]
MPNGMWGNKMKSGRRLTARAFVASIPVLLAGTGAARASDMVYTPTNPSFGGNPFNSSHLLGVANAINKYKDPAASTSSDPAAQFLRTLQSRLLSTLASQITDVIFGENAQESGLIKFGDQEISFVRGIDSVTLTISDLATGSVSEIIVPLLQGAD